MEKSLYICSIKILEDGVVSSKNKVLICSDKDLEILTAHIDRKSFLLVETKWLGDSVSLDVKDFVVENTGLETGKV